MRAAGPVLEGRDPVADRFDGFGRENLDRPAELLQRHPLVFWERRAVPI